MNTATPTCVASSSGCADASACHSPETKEVDMVINTDICYTCMEKFPPVKSKGKKLRRKKKIDWVGCDGCGKWFHCDCLNLKLKDIGDTFLCNDCKKEVHN